MANFDEFKQKTEEAAVIIAGMSVQFAQKAADTARKGAKLAKLNTGILAEKENIRKAYGELGKAYFELFKDEPDDELSGRVKQIQQSMTKIKMLRAEIDAVKGRDSADDADFDIEVEVIEYENSDEENE